MAWKPEVFVEGKWQRNGLAFPTEAEAFANACALMDRWMNVNDARAVEVEGIRANYHWTDGKLKAIPEPD